MYTISSCRLRGRYAFDSTKRDGIAQRTVLGDYNLYDYVWETISEEGKELIEGMLEVNPTKRITLAEALNHTWFSIATKDFNKTENSI
jgi:serine/threonine protein kinase